LVTDSLPPGPVFFLGYSKCYVLSMYYLGPDIFVYYETG